MRTDLLAWRYYIPRYSLICSDTPDSGFDGASDGGDPDIKGGSGCKQWRGLNNKEESEKSDDEEVHGEVRYGKREIK